MDWESIWGLIPACCAGRKVTLPSGNEAGLAYDFYDTERRIAYLRVEHMEMYRERCERDPNSTANCASIPSATETFKSLVIELEAAGFAYDFTDDVETFHALFPLVPATYEGRVREMPTFYAEYEAGTHAGYYTPDKVVVLVTPGTFSAGSTMLRHLYLGGATLVGTPSGQAADCFGNGKKWHLNHTDEEASEMNRASKRMGIDAVLERAIELPRDSS